MMTVVLMVSDRPAVVPGEVVCPDVGHRVHEAPDAALVRGSGQGVVQKKTGDGLLNFLETKMDRFEACVNVMQVTL